MGHPSASRFAFTPSGPGARPPSRSQAAFSRVALTNLVATVVRPEAGTPHSTVIESQGRGSCRQLPRSVQSAAAAAAVDFVSRKSWPSTASAFGAWRSCDMRPSPYVDRDGGRLEVGDASASFSGAVDDPRRLETGASPTRAQRSLSGSPRRMSQQHGMLVRTESVAACVAS